MNGKVSTSLLAALMAVALFISACAIQPLPMAEEEPPRAETESGSITPDEILSMDADAPLPFDDKVISGALDNGLQYLIRENGEPANRAELRLVVNAGSTQEEDDQLGVAHLLEHMLFNGTERFEGQELINFMEGIGMGFGPDVNAYTSFDETVYQLRIPTDDPEIVATALDILEDWAGYATIGAEELDGERGVVVEEERVREQNANGRVRDQLIPFLIGGSQYELRRPIGEVEIIKSVPQERVLQFYRDWYRPDLMTVIAIGDFDGAEMETMIRERFSTLPQPEDPRPLATFEIPAYDGARYKVITDPEFPNSFIQIYLKRDAKDLISGNDYRDILISSLYSRMLNTRLDERTRETDAPFLSAGAGNSSFVRPIEFYAYNARTEDAKIRAAYEALLTEVERVARYGFTVSELERAKLELVRSYEDSFNERTNRDHASFAEEYIRYILEADAAPGIEFEYALVRAYVPEISLDDITDFASELAAIDERAVLVIAPEKEDLDLPDEAELAAILEGVASKEIDPYEDQLVSAELIPVLPAPAAIVHEESWDEIGVSMIELENGVRVLMKPTEFSNDEVIFTAVSPGGSSQVDDDAYPEASMIASVVSESGLGELSYNDLLRLLAGKTVTVTPAIRTLTEGFDGSAGIQDLEELFQLLHLYFVAPSADEGAFETERNQIRTQVENRSLNPTSALQDAYLEARYGDTIRVGPLPLAEIETLDRTLALQIYLDRYGDAGDFIFAFVGDFEVDALKQLAQIYLGTLPADDRQEAWVDVIPDPPQEAIERTVFKGQDDRSIVQVLYSDTLEPTLQNRLLLEYLGIILDIRVREELRVELGGVYSPGATARMDPYPDQLYFAGVFFSADPDRVEELLDAAYAVIDELQSEGISPENLAKARETLLRSHEQSLEDNSFWLGTLRAYAVDQSVDPLDVLTYPARVAAVTAEEIQALAQQILVPESSIQLILYPEGFEGQD